MISYFLTILILLTTSFLYALFDVFNKRDVPDLFVYLFLAVGILITLTYGLRTIYTSALIALAIGGIGYVLYRKGFLGAGDFFEFATISLLLPVQPIPILSNVLQFGLPFVFSVLIGTGYSALIFIIIYYLFFVKSEHDKEAKPSKESMIKGAVLLVAYIFLIFFVAMISGITLVSAFLILLIAVPSSMIMVYEKLINIRMVSYVYPRTLTEGDMIATNFMSRAEINYFRKRSKSFGRLVTIPLYQDIKNVKKRLPVYKNAVPLALFIFIGVIISLLFGNILLYII